MYRQLSSSQLNFFKILDEKIEMVSNKLFHSFSLKKDNYYFITNKCLFYL